MSPSESLMVLPALYDSRTASSLAFFSTRSASLYSSRPRSAASIVAHGPDSTALRAALTALSTSLALPSATLAITSPVAGLYVSNDLPSTGSTHSLLMRSLVWVMAGAAGRCLIAAGAAMVAVLSATGMVLSSGWHDTPQGGAVKKVASPVAGCPARRFP